MKEKSQQFKTEVKQLLDLVINSMYSKKEIFLRELISNASDAIDRAKFEALTNPDILSDGDSFSIRLIPNKEAKTLTVIDNGIGMSAEDAERNLGTIAGSGTRAFLAALKEKQDKPEMIGQFGVGFYAAFMVAGAVDVFSKKSGCEAVHWSSDGTGSFKIGPADKSTRGTEIVLHLRDDESGDYTDGWMLKSIVRRYSDFIAYPVILDPDPSVKPEKKDGGKEEKPSEPETVNTMKAIWKKPKGEVSEEELNTFYTHLSHDYAKPLCDIRIAAEGATEFKALLFIPSEAPYDLFIGERKNGLQLYVRGVFIGDDIKELLPPYLRFVKGVVESADLPLNVSREILQDDAIVRRIRKALVSKVLGKLEDLQKNKPEDYKKFYGTFGRVLKEGLHEDFENADKLKELVMFPSTFTEGNAATTLKDYVSRMPSSQKDIYGLAAESIESARQSPLLEAFSKRGYEVLFFVDAIDDWITDRLRDYDKKNLVMIDRGEIKFDDESTDEKKKEMEEAKSAFAPLFEAVKERLPDDVKEVRLTSRLTESVCCLVADEYGPTARMERMMRAFQKGDASPEPGKRILEINPDHPLARKMLDMAKADKADAKLGDYIELIFGEALLAEGSPVKNPAKFSKLLTDMMTAN